MPQFTAHTAVCWVISCLASVFLLSIAFRSRDTWVVSPPKTSTYETQGTGPCRIWNDWADTDRDRLSYSAVNTASPIVGDPGFIGNPTSCLNANSRLDRYRGRYTSHGRLWSDVRWGEVQTRCAMQNFGSKVKISSLNKFKLDYFESNIIEPESVSRTAIVIRTWDDYDYKNDNQMAWIRALITEVALHSRGEMQVFLLVNVKDNDTPIFEDPALYQAKLQQSVPEELWDISFLWNERLLRSWYPLVEEHSPQLQMYQAFQIFAQHQPQFEYFWQLEMDFRFTAHTFDSLNNASTWAREQPRKNLWERNGRFYIPSLFNDSYAEFAAQVEHENAKGIWGPVKTNGFIPEGPTPPPRDSEKWGVGEEAELITFMPMVDPSGTDWVYENVVHNFADGLNTPRRFAIIAVTRTSRRLLHLVSRAQRHQGQWVVSESMMETFSLLHGLKAVYVPQGITFQNNLTPAEIDQTINHGPPNNRAGGPETDVIFTNHGYVDWMWSTASYWWWANTADAAWKDYVNGACSAPMLLHPVKNDRPDETTDRLDNSSDDLL